MSIFNQIKVGRPKRTAFNLSHNFKMTGEMGVLYPIMCQDVVPGDTFKCNTEIFCRLLPMIAPMMSRVRIYTHYFFVPKRLLWDKWEEFISGVDPSKNRGSSDQSDYVPPSYPRFQFPNKECFDQDTAFHAVVPYKAGELADYLGFPVFDQDDQDHRYESSVVRDANGKVTTSKITTIDALPFRAYQLIWNEYYRDQNLMDEIDIAFDHSGVEPMRPLLYPLMYLRRRAWKKDYFTSALPFAQMGPDVTLPLTGLQNDETQLYVDFLPNLDSLSQNVLKPQRSGNIPFKRPGELVNTADGQLYSNPVSPAVGDGDPAILDIPRTSDGSTSLGVGNQQLKDLLSNIGSATINELRRAFAAQRFLEATARGGSRYTELLYSIFGVRSSDARLQRPEYLGGGVQDIVVSDVLQTSSTDENSPQANQAGIGASLGRAGGFRRFFEEHGYVIGIMSIMPDASYQQGMPKQYMKFDRYDHYWPQFAHLGEQEIKESEIYCNGGNASDTTYDDDTLFGYTPRYAEYKYIPSTVHGRFRDNLNFWHLGRIFDSAPGLNYNFIECKPRTDIFAVENNPDKDLHEHHFLFNIQHHLKAVRPMPRFGTPS